MADATSTDLPKSRENGFVVTMAALMAVLAKRASRLSGKLKAATEPMREEWKIELRSTRSALARPKKLLTDIGGKTLPFGKSQRQKKKREQGQEWGNGGVWQKTILMGDKCKPLDFSGVIYYDSNGKQMNEVPMKSPRVSPMPGFLTRRRQLGPPVGENWG